MKIAAVVLAWFFFANIAEAGSFALTCIKSNTGQKINFQYRWGSNDSWKSASVRPGYWQQIWHMYDYPDENRSPRLQVRYDDDLSASSNFVITSLNSYSAYRKDCEGEGREYVFWRRGSELFIGDVR